VKYVLNGEKPQDAVKKMKNCVTKPNTAKVKDTTKTQTADPVNQLQNKLQNLLKMKKNLFTLFSLTPRQ
jgi:hypothetical protein